MIFQRLEINIGKDNVNMLSNKTVLIIGVGGVGSFACEALVRSGIGKVILVDHDVVDITNINRQIIALHSTISKSKVEIMKDRINDINPQCEVVIFKTFYSDESRENIFTYDIDFVVDACDTISAKYDIIKTCLSKSIPFISAMGAANKVDPTKFEITTLEKTSYDPLAKVLRKKVKESRLKGKIPVVYSKEKKVRLDNKIFDGETRKQKYPPGSNAFTPSVSGLICASFVVNSLIAGKYWFN
ncbi:MAG: ThiF family adenylyltransferase [Bacilli bacterium]